MSIYQLSGLNDGLKVVSSITHEDHQGSHPLTDESATLLQTAYAQSEATTKEYSKSFYLASSLLPAPQQQAIRALYGFCRYTDNLVDDVQNAPFQELDWYRHEVNRAWHVQDNPLLLAWAHTRQQWQVPQHYGDELIEGCEMDLQRSRYETWSEVERYCYCVASTVGLMSMHIMGTAKGVSFDEARPFAVKLGVALQLTNILRDVREDASRGRIYLPLEDMQRFGVSEEDILQGRLNPQTRQLLQFEIVRAYDLYEEGWAGIRLLSEKARFSVAVAADVYRGILGKIAANGYDVFTRRAYLTTGEKLRRLPLIWLRLQRRSPLAESR